MCFTQLQEVWLDYFCTLHLCIVFCVTGTWLRPRKSKSPTIKLTRNQPTQIKLGDILYLLAPSHSDSKGYRYTLCKGLRKEQLVICQLVTPLKTQTDYTYNEILILDTQKSSLPSNKRKRKEDTVEDTVENSNATKRSCIIEIVPEPEELEKCPHCQQDYPLSQLILHVDNCPSLGASSADENRYMYMCISKVCSTCTWCIWDVFYSDLLN